MIDGARVVHEMTLAAPRDRVFSMFVEADQLVRWIGISADLEPRPGGRFRFEVVPGQFCEGRYVELTPPSRVVFTWGWTDPAMDVPPGSSVVEVTLTEAGSGTLLRLVHDQLPAGARLLHDDGWSRFLERLALVIRGAGLPAYPAGDPASRLARLTRRGQR